MTPLRPYESKTGSVNYRWSRLSERRAKRRRTALYGSREGEGLPDEKKSTWRLKRSDGSVLWLVIW
jgi:hypothetical protein